MPKKCPPDGRTRWSGVMVAFLGGLAALRFLFVRLGRDQMALQLSGHTAWSYQRRSAFVCPCAWSPLLSLVRIQHMRRGALYALALRAASFARAPWCPAPSLKVK